MLAELVVVIVADVGDQEETLGEFRLQLDEAGLVAVLGRETRRVDPLGLLLCAEDQIVATREFDNAVPVIS